MSLFFLGVTEYFKGAQFSRAVEEFEPSLIACNCSHTLQIVHNPNPTDVFL